MVKVCKGVICRKSVSSYVMTLWFLVSFIFSSNSVAQTNGRFTVQGLPDTFSTLSQAEAALRSISQLHSQLTRENSELVSKNLLIHNYEVDAVNPEDSEERYRVERLVSSDQYFNEAQTALDTRGAEIYRHSPLCAPNSYEAQGDWRACDTYSVLDRTSEGDIRSVTAFNRRPYHAIYRPRYLDGECREFRDGLTLFREGIQTCPTDYQGQISSCSFDCVNPTTGVIFEQVEGKDDGCNENNEANPCNVSTGNKFQPETDFSSNTLGLTRTYNSQSSSDHGFGRGWTSNLQRSLIVGVDVLRLESGSGRSEPWEKINGMWQGDADSDVSITETTGGFSLTRSNGSSENYNIAGRLRSQTDTNGHQTVFEYNSDNQLISITHHYGTSIHFAYSNENIVAVTDTFGAVYRYEYADDNLVAVIFPDTTPNDDSDNPRKIYHYENVDLPNHLTGITDENGDRYSSYAYDAQGRVISSEHARTTNINGQGKVQLDFQGGAQ